MHIYIYIISFSSENAY